MTVAVDLEKNALGLWGISGQFIKLPGEKDSNYHIKATTNQEFLLKISSSDESFDAITLQSTILQQLAQHPRSFEFPRQILSKSGHLVESIQGKTNFIRLFTFISGELLGELPFHSENLIKSLGTQIGHLSLALANIPEPMHKPYSKWDLHNAGWIAHHLEAIVDAKDRALVEQCLVIFEEVKPKLLTMRQQMIHGDLNDYNILVKNNQVSGFIDFNDAVWSQTISELAIALSYIMMNKSDPIKTALEVIKAYRAIFPLKEEELALLYDLICTRLCVSVVNSALRKKENPQDPYLCISEKPAWALLKKLQEIPRGKAIDYFGHPCDFQTLIQMRKQYFSKNLSLSYDKPLHFVRGQGQFLYDNEGNRYLDGVNNVAHVGHCHPHVVKAGQEQMALLNTNTRYLHELLGSYAQKLVKTLPKPLEVCFFVSSGSEANELALRLARTHTGKHNIAVLDNAYHGNTTTLIDISPYKFKGKGGQGQPEFVKVLPMPYPYRQENLSFSENFDDNIAAFIAEPLLSCGGQIELPVGYLQSVYNAVRKSGGLCVCDEIQVGFGRLGSHFWGFETQEVIPDIITLGKPMGNGHPIGAVITTRAIADSFCNGMEYFSTFGGNPVSCAIGLAVLEVIEQEQLQESAHQIGQYLKSELIKLKSSYPIIGDVRGRGLFLGIEIIEDPITLAPSETLAKKLVNKMRDNFILLSTDGPNNNVIKFKPPMVFTKADADNLVGCFEKILQTSSRTQ